MLTLLRCIQGLVVGCLYGFTNLSVYCGYALAMWYGAEKVIEGRYTPGNIVTIIGLALLGGATIGQVCIRPVISDRMAHCAGQSTVSKH